MPLTKQHFRFPCLFLPRTQRDPARGREEKQQEDVTERWWATNPKENVSSSALLVLCSREECVIQLYLRGCDVGRHGGGS
jgi:hypothetical protein